MRLVLDSNCVISAIYWTGTPHQLLAFIRKTDHQIWVSDTILMEIFTVMHRPYFMNRANQKNTSPKELFSGFRSISYTASSITPLSHPVCRDPDDDHVLTCALSANAELIISGDDDLISLKEYQGIPILSPADALQLLQKL